MSIQDRRKDEEARRFVNATESAENNVLKLRINGKIKYIPINTIEKVIISPQ